MSTRNKPVKIDGIAYKPKWDWTPEYEKEVRHMVRETGKREKVPDEERVRQYIEWYAEQNGISADEAETALRAQGKIA